MHIYAFGSLCRGAVSLTSDVDLLAVVDGHDARFDPRIFSIYSYRRISEIWNEGNPFAWHLYLEARGIFSSDGSDYLRSLGAPARYVKYRDDCEKFYRLFDEARNSLEGGSRCVIFDLSAVFLALRNFATCFSLGALGTPDFSRGAALQIAGRELPIEPVQYSILERARILCTRGAGESLTSDEVNRALLSLANIEDWMKMLFAEVPDYDVRVQ